MRRKVCLLVTVIGVLPLVAAEGASAQGALLRVTPSSAAPGAEVKVTGRGLDNQMTSTNNNIRLSTRNGTILAPGFSVDPAGRIDVDIPVPNVPPGTYLIIATQDRTAALPSPPAPPGITGQPTSFGPARSTLRVTAPSAGSAAAAVPAGDTGNGPPLALVAAAGALLLLLAAGSTLTARRLVTLRRPQMGR